MATGMYLYSTVVVQVTGITVLLPVQVHVPVLDIGTGICAGTGTGTCADTGTGLTGPSPAWNQYGTQNPYCSLNQQCVGMAQVPVHETGMGTFP